MFYQSLLMSIGYLQFYVNVWLRVLLSGVNANNAPSFLGLFTLLFLSLWTKTLKKPNANCSE